MINAPKKSEFKSVTAKAALLVFLALLLSVTTVCSQDYKKFAFGPGLSINIGVFNPEDVNSYIASDLSNYTIIFGNTDMIIYYEVAGLMNFKTRWVDFTPMFAYAISPKIILGADEYYFTRMSPGILANFFIPIGFSGKHALMLGGGVQYHNMKFKEYSGTTIGFRAQVGFDLQLGNFNMQPLIAFNIANAEAVMGYAGDLNYTGGQIGLIMSFHKPVSHRN